MVLANVATLLGVSPRELADWFWSAYPDAYGWVVEPNVLGMGTFGLGDLFTTKPYVSGAAYINKMSDYCSDCAFSPKRDCPITSLSGHSSTATRRRFATTRGSSYPCVRWRGERTDDASGTVASTTGFRVRSRRARLCVPSSGHRSATDCGPTGSRAWWSGGFR